MLNAITALIVLTSHDQLGQTGQKTGWYLPEVSHVYYSLVEAGVKVQFVSPQGGKAPMDQKSLDLKDSYNKRFTNDAAAMAQTENTLPAAKVKSSDYQIIYFAGGHGTMWDLPEDKNLARITAEIYERGGIVASVCHGGAGLVNVKLSNGKYLVSGKPLNSFTDAEEKAVELDKVVPFLLESRLRERGAQIVAGAPWSNTVVVSERLVTGQNPQSAFSVGKAIVALLPLNK